MQQPDFALQPPDLSILLISNVLRLQREPGPAHDLVGQECEGETFEQRAAVGLVVGAVGTAARRVEIRCQGSRCGCEELDGGGSGEEGPGEWRAVTSTEDGRLDLWA